MKTNNQILVPIDFTEKSLLAFEQAKYFAKMTNSDIMLLNVIHLDSKSFSFVFSIFSDLEKDLLSQKIEKGVWEKLNELIESNKNEGITIQGMIATGKVYEKVLETSKSLNCNFIIIGSNDDDIEDSSLGTNASRIVRMSDVPVITVNKNIMKEMKNLILPLDLSKDTQQKVAKAIKIARYTNAKISIVSIVFTNDQKIIRTLEVQMNVIGKFVKEHYGNVSTEIVYNIKDTGSIATNLSSLVLDYAYKNNGDVIMIMTQPEKTWLKFFFSATAMDLIFKSTIPVISVIPKEVYNTSYR